MDRRAFNKLATGTVISVWAPGIGVCLQSDQVSAFAGLPLLRGNEEAPQPKIVDRYGIPFVAGDLSLDANGTARVNLSAAAKAKRIFLLGMVHSGNPRAWADPNNRSVRYFIGDELGKIHLNYADGAYEAYPLILGDSIWWGQLFFLNPNPFPSDPELRRSLAASLRLYPPSPVADGKYVASIVPRPVPIRSITVEDSPAKKGAPVISGITLELDQDSSISGSTPLPFRGASPEFAQVVGTAALSPLEMDAQPLAQNRLEALRRALYTSDEQFQGTVAQQIPAGFTGPKVSFSGDIFAQVLTNIFPCTLQDMLAKIDVQGMYHTSTKGSVSWGSYHGFGTYRENVGPYYDQSYARDLGRSLHELTALGYVEPAARCADWCLRQARLWEKRPDLKIDSIVMPRHWCRIINRPGIGGCFENDGHGLIAVFLFRLWQRLPDRQAWLTSRWVDVAAAGDWILWQFDHPEISQATDVLHTTGESSDNGGYTVYADVVCRNALLGLAEMADSIGDGERAAHWRNRAGRMKQAIASRYIVSDAKYGRVWTLESAGWPHKSTVLGPSIFSADSSGLAPQDDSPNWRPVNEATYQRLVDSYQPFGFYGQAMGYGQGFVTQAALLLDRMRDATEMLQWMAKQIHDPRFGSFIVPEGCEIDATGRFWYRIGDLGNGVQEAEIIKALRIVIGVDDVRPNRLQFFPRMPYGWNEIAVNNYPIVFEHAGMTDTAQLHFKLRRLGENMELEIASDKQLGPVTARLGPFPNRPHRSFIRVNGIHNEASAEHSGDSWWMSLTIAVGPDHN